MQIFFKKLCIIALLICGAGSTACERRLRVTIERETPPTFAMSGSGEVQSVFTYKVTEDGRVPPKDSELWVIIPKPRLAASASPKITYGIVPDGFSQKVPAVGSPPILEEGGVYGIGAITTEAPGGDIWFTIKNSKAVRVPKTDPANPDVP